MEKFQVKFNDAAAKKHAPEIERMTRAVKEWCRVLISSFPWKKATPMSTRKEGVKHTVMMINFLSPCHMLAIGTPEVAVEGLIGLSMQVD